MRKEPATATSKRKRPAARGPKAPKHPKAKAPRPSLRVDWADVGPISVPNGRALAALATRVLKQEGQSGLVNLVFCEDSMVRRLNHQFRNLDKVTDVLSFHYGEEDADPEGPWGEIYIATPQAHRQAPRWKNSFFDELRRLVVHGSLHLAGYDHMKASERLTMRAREDHYLTHGK